MDATIGSLTNVVPVRTTADAPQVIPAAPNASDAGDRESYGQHDPRDSRREVSDDQTTGSLVFRVVDITTGDVTAQTPTDAQLKLRAYIDRIVPSAAGSSLVRQA